MTEQTFILGGPKQCSGDLISQLVHSLMEEKNIFLSWFYFLINIGEI